jgi:dephospho-CoA kinase
MTHTHQDHPDRIPPHPYVLRVGLTGGIATGKTTVGRTFTELGATVLDADAIAHQLIEKGAEAYEPVARAFGNEIMRNDGSIDRSCLGRIIFADDERRATLESILHPLIRAEEEVRIARLAARGQARIFVTNAALLIETGHYRDYSRVVVAYCDEATQIERIVRRDHLSEEETRARIASQMGSDEKMKVAHYVIDTSPGFAATESRAREVFRHLQFDLQALSST